MAAIARTALLTYTIPNRPRASTAACCPKSSPYPPSHTTSRSKYWYISGTRPSRTWRQHHSTSIRNPWATAESRLVQPLPTWSSALAECRTR